MEFAVGSFNFGVDQKMLQGRPFERRHRGNFARVVAKMVEEGNLDIVFGCEVGGPRQGCSRAMINVKDILEEPFGDISVAEVDNYIAVCGFQPPPTVVLRGSSEKFVVPTGRDVDAAITRFDILWSDTSGASQPAVHIVAGDLRLIYAGLLGEESI